MNNFMLIQCNLIWAYFLFVYFADNGNYVTNFWLKIQIWFWLEEFDWEITNLYHYYTFNENGELVVPSGYKFY